MSEPHQSTNVPLNDVMIAMDVVDTLRHDRRIVARELNDEGRRKQLVDELREIYRGQGIEVSDAVLEEGVRALEEDRFVYKPPPDSFETRIAKYYVTRESWGKYVLGAVIGLFALLAVNYFAFERPRHLEAARTRVELRDLLPARIKQIVTVIGLEADDATISERARQISLSGFNAAKAGDLKGARKAEQRLADMVSKIRQEYTIRIVNRKGKLTGVWRVPKLNPGTYNYYLIVEALDAEGNQIARDIVNEETGKRARVKTWGIRVSKSMLESVKADKSDDGIVQNAVVGVKTRGSLEPAWKIDVPSGAITTW